MSKPSSSSDSRRKPTKPSIIPDGATRSAPARAYDSAARPEVVQRRVVVDLALDDDAAVAVRRVFAEAGVDRQHQLRDRLLDRAQRALDDALVVPRLAADVVLLLGQAEQDHGRDAELRDLLRLAHDLVDRELELARQRRDLAAHALARADEQRVDEVVGRQRRLAHHAAQRGRAAQASGTGLGEGHRRGE